LIEGVEIEEKGMREEVVKEGTTIPKTIMIT
jgi:hypothetical protein